jgi:nucleoside-diphosphate-sugar epimerase
MQVFVVGGTGAIGRWTLPALVQAGHRVTAVARTPDKAAWVARQGATPITLSMFDRAALTAAFLGHEAVINLATAIPPTTQFLRTKAWAANNRIRMDGSAAIVDAAIAAGVGRVVQESVSMVYPDRGAAWIDEACPPDTFPMAAGNLAAEASAQRFADAGGTGIVLRFGWFYGPGATHSEEFFALARHHIAIMLGAPHTFVSSIHVADAGAAVVAALAVPGGTYNVVDNEPLTKRQYADALASAAGTTAWLRVPGRAALLFGHRTTSLTRSVRVSNARFRAASGWTPRYPSAREGWIATAHALAARAGQAVI